MDSNINIRLKTMLGSLIPTTKRASQEWKTFGRSISNTQKTMSRLYPSIRKTNMSLTNLTKDANRASKGFSMMSGSLLTVKRALGGLSFYMLYRGISNAVESAMDMIETANLFSVALGGLAVETNNTVRGMSELTGLDLTNMQTAIGTFASLSRSMGMTDTQAQNLSTTSYRLALDLASLYNVDISQALGDLRSGLVGQSETVYKYGIDVTEASLKTEALAQGITKSVRNMSQGEKMALRYAVMIRQTSLAQGDFARTIEQPANQLRILSERFVTLGRSIGTIFIPVLQAILPYLNAVLQVLINIANTIASFFGYSEDMAKVTNTGFGSMVDSSGELEDNLNGATGSAKKLKSALAGFDEINVLGSKQEAGGAGGTGAMAGGMDMSFMETLSYDSMFGSIKTKSTEIADTIKLKLDELWNSTYRVRYALKDLWDEGLSLFGNFSIGALRDFYESFLKPVGTWVIGEGLPKFFNIVNDLLKNVDWGRLRESLNGLWEALVPLAINVGEGLLWFLENVISPLTEILVETVIPAVIDDISLAITALSDFINANKDVLETGAKLIGAFFLAWEVTKLLAFLELSGSVTGALALMSKTILGLALAKLADKIETMALIGLYAKDFIVKIAKATAELVKLIIQFGLSTGAKILNTVATVASTVAHTAWTVAVTLATTAGKLFGAVLTFLTSPVGLLVIAIGALIAIGVLLYKNWDTVKEHANKTWEAIKTSISKFASVISQEWSKLWTGVANFFINIANGVIGGFEGMINKIITGVNKFIGWIKKIPFIGDNIKVNIIGSVSLDRISQIKASVPTTTKPMMMANGGIPDYGQVFIAREAGAELVGGFGSKTAVMNNDQIVEAVSSGVAQAVASVMGSASGGTMIQVKIGEDTIVEKMVSSINRQNRLTGKTVINV